MLSQSASGTNHGCY